MPTIEKLLNDMRANQKQVGFSSALKVCIHYFGAPRIRGSHHMFRVPWKGDPRINIQNRKGYVIEYQVKQVIKAIDRLEGEENV